jgi:hypothetical protein
MRDEQVRELAKSSPSAAPAPLARSAPAAAARGALQAATDWSHARITVQGRAVEVSREQAGPLVRWLARIPRNEAGTGSFDSRISERIELMQNGVTVEVIELAGDQLRWSRPPQSGITQPDRALLQELREELGRLAQR